MIIRPATHGSLAREIHRRILRPLRLRDTACPERRAGIPGRSSLGHTLAVDDDLTPVEGPLLDLTVHDRSCVWAPEVPLSGMQISICLDIMDHRSSPDAASCLFDVGPVGRDHGVAASQRTFGDREVHRVRQS